MQQNAASAAASSPFSAYADRPQLGLDVEFGADPACGAAFFQSDGRKHDDLKEMLDSNKDGLKLEAMKRIIGMIARGRDASNLFPAVVKNVVSKNIEVKKLVYVYLVRYAEEQQDLALLSISTFQRALKDPNQLIRASALRVLSSIRVNMIVPIVMLAIRDSAADLSPYVRKTAAHAIPKLYSLDPDQKDELVTVIEKLLSDRTTLVVGSAVMAFDEVCPERVDLIHKNYRKLCNLLVDVDEWGQVIIINMLTRYARTQFEDPNADEDLNAAAADADADPDTATDAELNQQTKNNADVPFYNDEPTASSSSSSSSSASSDGDGDGDGENDDETNEKHKKNKKSKTEKSTSSKKKLNNNNNNDKKEKSTKKSTTTTTTSSSTTLATSTTATTMKTTRRDSSPALPTYVVDADHRLLLRQTKPLLQSRNASVVMAVAQLYHHIAPRNEVLIIAKALIRLLRSHKEVQSVVLTCIASMSTRRKTIFEPHLKSFFVRTSDPTHIKLLKLDILTNLATAPSIALILREFQTYISSSDRSFVAATIQAIGRCAASISEVTETCLNGLVHLLSNRDEHVVAESVVVIKNLLQTKAAEHYEIITQMAKLIDFITVPAARAAIIWLIGEYNEKVPKIAPDVLRKMAKTFVDEEDIVKLQVLNLGVKLYLTNPQQTSLLCQYVFTLARYDTNYDVRDRARFLRQFVFPASGKSTVLSENARKVFLAPKPAPIPESKYRDSNNFQLGSLSHYLNIRATGYKELPFFPSTAPDSSVRNIEGFMSESTSSTTTTTTPGATTDGGDKAAATGAKKKQKPEKNLLSGLDEKSPANSDASSSSSSGSGSDSESGSEDSAPSTKTKAVKKKAKKESSAGAVASATLVQLDTSSNSNKNDGDGDGDDDVENASSSGTSDSESSSSYTSSSEGSDSDSGSDNDDDDDDVAESKDNDDDDDDDDEDDDDDDDDDVTIAASKETSKSATNKKSSGTAAKSNLDLLLDLDDIPPIGPVMTPSLGGFLTPGTPSFLGLNAAAVAGSSSVALQPQHISNQIELVGPSYIEFKHKELLNKVTGHGLQLSYRFTRSPHLYSSAMATIELQFVNRTNDEITAIQVGQKTLPTGMQLNEFAPVQQLQPMQTVTSILGVDFNDSTHSIDFEIKSSVGVSRVTLKPPIGELIRAVAISETCFKDERTKLRGMNEHQSHLQATNRDLSKTLSGLKQKVFECINVAYIPLMPSTAASTSAAAAASADIAEQLLYFAGQTLTSKCLVLITLQQQQQTQSLALTVNCEKMVIGSMVLNELRNTLQAYLKA